jgi:hypothetical protein
MNQIEKVLETMDQMVLPASTADVYNRMMRLGYVAGHNIARERADISSLLARMRKRGIVQSTHDEDGILLWDVSEISTKPVLRLTNETKAAVRDEINRLRKDAPMQIVLATLFDDIAASLTHAADALRKL